jgi:hypothetical protein
MLRSLAGRAGSGCEALSLPAAALQARLFAAEAGAKDEKGGQKAEPIHDAARASQPVRLHQLIGDPRTGVADDTTQALHGDLSLQWIWHQTSTDVSWYRYAIAGPDQLPYMHMDSRLSDHSKNLMYLLRCKDPER